jgi:hypothetical protein
LQALILRVVVVEDSEVGLRESHTKEEVRTRMGEVGEFADTCGFAETGSAL